MHNSPQKLVQAFSTNGRYLFEQYCPSAQWASWVHEVQTPPKCSQVFFQYSNFPVYILSLAGIAEFLEEC